MEYGPGGTSFERAVVYVDAVVRLRRDPALMGGRRTGRACVLQKARGIWVVTREIYSRPIGAGVFCVLF